MAEYNSAMAAIQQWLNLKNLYNNGNKHIFGYAYYILASLNYFDNKNDFI